MAPEIVNPASPSSIPLYLINGVATVWDAQVAATLHCVHGVSGLRAGTLPGVSSQNVFLGLPVTLMQEETAWLVQQGIAHLVPLPTSPLLALPPTSDISAYNAARQARIRAQQERQRVLEQAKSQEGRAKFAAGGEAARAKREARARMKAEKERARRVAEGEEVGGEERSNGEHGEADAEAALAPRPEPSISTASPERAGDLNDSTDASSATPTASGSSPTPTSRSLDPITGTHFHTIPPTPFFPPPSSSSCSTSITALPHPLFPFPSSLRDQALLSTFSHLHARGLRVGLGPRFGGEYLVYPGDYLRYHAHFTSQVIVDDEPITPAQVVAWGRLGTGTKKAGLLCCWTPKEKCDTKKEVEAEEEDQPYEKVDADLGEVEFYSLEWASFG